MPNKTIKGGHSWTPPTPPTPIIWIYTSLALTLLFTTLSTITALLLTPPPTAFGILTILAIIVTTSITTLITRLKK